MTRHRSLAPLLSVVLAAGAFVAIAPAESRAVVASPSARVAAAQLQADSGGTTVVSRDPDGDVSFVGAGDREIHNPSVDSSMSVEAAAQAHLSRYGGMLGLPDGSELLQRLSTHTLAGSDVVTYRQTVDGVPVIGGDVVVTLAPDRQLASLLSTSSDATAVGTPVVGAAEAEQIALGRQAAGLTATDQGRWVFDPSILGVSAPYSSRTVRRVEVGDGVGERRTVLVDDRTGIVLLDFSDIQSVDRVVCDKNNVRGNPTPCTSGFVRTEASGASGVTDVEDAFRLSGVVSTNYQQLAGIDLTQKLGVPVGGVKKLASTVRFCYPTGSCPLANAFWNGTQMVYGAGYSGADDVVGHEMTHGVIDQYSQLFYFGQSGAINESIADIMGEIIDHRNVGPGDSAGSWDLGEDLGSPIRNLQDPTLHGQPDRTGSASWTRDDVNYGDSGGVHTNSGVGNKTAYLISQGGTFNGQSVTGIDGGDAKLTRSGKLWFQVIQSLSSGSDYADLARVLDQSCQSLVNEAGSGFTAAMCANVHKAGLATQLSVEPVNAPHATDARATCPAGTVKRELFNSETGTPGSKFVPGATWARAPVADPNSWGSSPNAHSGTAAWYSSDPNVTTTSSLALKTGVALPAGRKSYLFFQHWRFFVYGWSGADLATRTYTYYDGGTVEADDVSTPAGPVSLTSSPWINGPVQPSSVGGAAMFGGDSFGYVASQVDLSSFAGRTVKPQFTTRTNSAGGGIGWWLDDVIVYTCDLPLKVGSAAVAGTPTVGKKLTARVAAWTAGTTFTYQWLRNGKPISKATRSTYQLAGGDAGKKVAVRVTGRKAGYTTASVTSKATGKVKAKPRKRR